MSLLNLAQAKAAAGTKNDAQYVYNGPGSWAIPADQVLSGSAGKVASPTLRDAPLPTAQPVAAAKSAPATPPYTVPMFVPMEKDKGIGAKDKFKGPGRPMHMANIDTRGHFLGWNFGFGYKGINDSDSLSGIYNSYFWSGVCFILMIATYFVHPAIAAVFAFLWGHYWSEYLLGNAWGIIWLKGKSMIHAY